MNLFISQLFTDECVYLPKYVFSYCFSIETLLFLIHTNILLFFNNKLLFYDLQLLLSNSLIFSFIYLVSQQKNLVLGLKVLIFTPSHVKKKNELRRRKLDPFLHLPHQGSTFITAKPHLLLSHWL